METRYQIDTYTLDAEGVRKNKHKYQLYLEILKLVIQEDDKFDDDKFPASSGLDGKILTRDQFIKIIQSPDLKLFQRRNEKYFLKIEYKEAVKELLDKVTDQKNLFAYSIVQAEEKLELNSKKTLEALREIKDPMDHFDFLCKKVLSKALAFDEQVDNFRFSKPSTKNMAPYATLDTLLLVFIWNMCTLFPVSISEPKDFSAAILKLKSLPETMAQPSLNSEVAKTLFRDQETFQIFKQDSSSINLADFFYFKPQENSEPRLNYVKIYAAMLSIKDYLSITTRIFENKDINFFHSVLLSHVEKLEKNYWQIFRKLLSDPIASGQTIATSSHSVFPNKQGPDFVAEPPSTKKQKVSDSGGTERKNHSI